MMSTHVTKTLSTRALLGFLLMASSSMADVLPPDADIPQVRGVKNGTWISLTTSHEQRITGHNGELGTCPLSPWSPHHDPHSNHTRFQIVHNQDTSPGAYGKDPCDNLIRHGDRVFILSNKLCGSTHDTRGHSDDWAREHSRYLTVFPDALTSSKWKWNYSPKRDHFGFMADHEAWQTFEVCKTRYMNTKCIDPIVRDDDQISLKPCVSPNVFHGDVGGSRKSIGDAKTFRDAVGVDKDGNFYCSPRIGNDHRLQVHVVYNGMMCDTELIQIDYDMANIKKTHSTESISGAYIDATNNGTKDKTFEYSISQTKGKSITSSWSSEHSRTTQKGIEYTVSAGVPEEGEGESFKFSNSITTEAKHTKSGGLQWDDTTEVTYKTTCTIPPGKRVVDICIVENVILEIPMQATYRGVADKVSIGMLVVTQSLNIKDTTKMADAAQEKQAL